MIGVDGCEDLCTTGGYIDVKNKQGRESTIGKKNWGVGIQVNIKNNVCTHGGEHSSIITMPKR